MNHKYLLSLLALLGILSSCVSGGNNVSNDSNDSSNVIKPDLVASFVPHPHFDDSGKNANNNIKIKFDEKYLKTISDNTPINIDVNVEEGNRIEINSKHFNTDKAYLIQHNNSFEIPITVKEKNQIGNGKVIVSFKINGVVEKDRLNTMVSSRTITNFKQNILVFKNNDHQQQGQIQADITSNAIDDGDFSAQVADSSVEFNPCYIKHVGAEGKTHCVFDAKNDNSYLNHFNVDDMVWKSNIRVEVDDGQSVNDNIISCQKEGIFFGGSGQFNLEFGKLINIDLYKCKSDINTQTITQIETAKTVDNKWLHIYGTISESIPKVVFDKGIFLAQGHVKVDGSITKDDFNQNFPDNILLQVRLENSVDVLDHTAVIKTNYAKPMVTINEAATVIRGNNKSISISVADVDSPRDIKLNVFKKDGGSQPVSNVTATIGDQYSSIIIATKPDAELTNYYIKAQLAGKDLAIKDNGNNKIEVKEQSTILTMLPTQKHVLKDFPGYSFLQISADKNTQKIYLYGENGSAETASCNLMTINYVNFDEHGNPVIGDFCSLSTDGVITDKTCFIGDNKPRIFKIKHLQQTPATNAKCTIRAKTESATEYLSGQSEITRVDGLPPLKLTAKDINAHNFLNAGPSAIYLWNEVVNNAQPSLNKSWITEFNESTIANKSAFKDDAIFEMSQNFFQVEGNDVVLYNYPGRNLESNTTFPINFIVAHYGLRPGLFDLCNQDALTKADKYSPNLGCSYWTGVDPANTKVGSVFIPSGAFTINSKGVSLNKPTINNTKTWVSWINPADDTAKFNQPPYLAQQDNNTLSINIDYYAKY